MLLSFFLVLQTQLLPKNRHLHLLDYTLKNRLWSGLCIYIFYFFWGGGVLVLFFTSEITLPVKVTFDIVAKVSNLVLLLEMEVELVKD